MIKLTYVNYVIILVSLLDLTIGKQCDRTTVVHNQCSANETCTPTADPKYGTCICKPGLVRVNGTHCMNITKSEYLTSKSSSLIDKNEPKNSGHVAAGILVPLLFITVVICGIYFSRKYRIMSYIRGKLYQRNRNYDEVMIGQDLDDDDPPLH